MSNKWNDAIARLLGKTSENEEMIKKLDAVIEQLTDVWPEEPATKKKVAAAEARLGVTFADDYRAYLLKYGCIDSTEVQLTGITDDPDGDVIELTEREREVDPDFPRDAYVIHYWAYDGIVSIQYTNGEIYAVGPGYETTKMNDSLIEYIEEEIRMDKEYEAQKEADENQE